MNPVWPRIIAACLLAAPLASSAAERPDILGRALHPDTGEVLYLERHYCNEEEQSCRVLYQLPDDSLIALKTVDYRLSSQAPGLFFEDYRHQRELRLDPTQATQAQGSELVVDAGFDNFVRARWDTLADGGTLRFPFLPLGREKPLAMRIGPRAGDGCDQQLCLQVELDSWFLGMLVDPVELTYDRSQRRLLRFRGISNIPTAEGGGQSVDLHYSYSDTLYSASTYSHQGGNSPR